MNRFWINYFPFLRFQYLIMYFFYFFSLFFPQSRKKQIQIGESIMFKDKFYSKVHKYFSYIHLISVSILFIFLINIVYTEIFFVRNYQDFNNNKNLKKTINYFNYVFIFITQQSYFLIFYRIYYSQFQDKSSHDYFIMFIVLIYGHLQTTYIENIYYCNILKKIKKTSWFTLFQNISILLITQLLFGILSFDKQKELFFSKVFSNSNNQVYGSEFAFKFIIHFIVSVAYYTEYLNLKSSNITHRLRHNLSLCVFFCLVTLSINLKLRFISIKENWVFGILLTSFALFLYKNEKNRFY